MNKDHVVAMLRMDVCKVKFTKADDSVREMFCTLRDEYITQTSAGGTPDRPNLVTCWDVEKDAWRSFRLDRLIDGPYVATSAEKEKFTKLA